MGFSSFRWSGEDRQVQWEGDLLGSWFVAVHGCFALSWERGDEVKKWRSEFMEEKWMIQVSLRSVSWAQSILLLRWEFALGPFTSLDKNGANCTTSDGQLSVFGRDLFFFPFAKTESLTIAEMAAGYRISTQPLRMISAKWIDKCMLLQPRRQSKVRLRSRDP